MLDTGPIRAAGRQHAVQIRCLVVLLEESLELVDISANELVNLLAILEKVEGGHGGNAKLGGHVAGLIDINLEALDVGELLGKGLKLGANHAARTAPGSGEVNGDDARGDLLLELGERLDHGRHGDGVGVFLKKKKKRKKRKKERDREEIRRYE